ncbi:MAG TPA: phage portal protein [Chloroflexi bacterium]|nr:phage portal protein [Chloroflexota bacterium]
MQTDQPQGLWIGPDGQSRPVRVKGGPLFDWFHGIRRGQSRELSGSKADLARAYASAVWAYRCIKLRADAVAGVPLILLDRSGEPINEHPLLTLLRDVNPATMNLGDLLRATEAAYNIWGVAYWLKVFGGRNGDGRRVRWLVWLNPQTVEPVVDAEQGITSYRQTVGTRTREFGPEEMIVFRNFDPLDDLGGLSPLSVALSEINAELNAARFVAAFFANDARPAGLLTSDQPLHDTDIERTRVWWQRLFRGAGNKWKTGIVGGGLRWQTITFPPTDLALRDLRAEDRRAICAAFGVPSALAGAWEAATYATAREQKASFYEDTIIPQLEYLAEVLNWSLLPHYPDLVARGARLAWDLDSIAALRESATDKAQRLAMLFETGLVTRNEVRAGLGMPLLPEEEDGFVFELQGGADAAGRAQEPPSRDGEETTVTVPPDGAKSLRDELKRWERFAVRRVRAGKALRPFESAVIPPALWSRISEALGRAETVEDVRRIFDEVEAMTGEADDQDA